MANSGFVFWTPAHQQDFPNDPAKQDLLEKQWNINLDAFIQQGITGNPWNATNSSNITNYFNPLTTPIPAGSTPQQITWPAFPGRPGQYNTQDNWGLTSAQILQLADTGYYGNNQTFPNITTNPCTQESESLPFGPYGPRGWQDEYCEWSVRRVNGKIVRVDITCENPEYWNTLWRVDPNKVLALYQQTLSKPQIQLKDLYLTDTAGNPVIDPSTGKPAYNPLNKWNSGPISTDSQGGAMHLTSTPNTLQTEIGLACAATIQRQTAGPSNPNQLICCAQYGQIYRNSDPHIGASVNAVVAGDVTGSPASVTLTNPPGLYIQDPSPSTWATYTTPDGTDASTFWNVVRGTETLNDSSGNPLPGNFNLHVVFEVPASKGYTVSDIKINGQPIQWAGQIIQTFLMQIVATPITASLPPSVPCVGTPATSLSQPLQLFYTTVFKVMDSTNVSCPVQPSPYNMTLVSNSTLIPPTAARGSQNLSMILTAIPVGSYTVEFDDPNITATVQGSFPVYYAVPGNTYPGPATAIQLSVNVGQNASPGLHGILLTNKSCTQNFAMPGLLFVA